jgi:hypothetical protein
MENFGNRATLILAAGFLIVNFGLVFFLAAMPPQTAVRCTYSGSSVTCAPGAG